MRGTELLVRAPWTTHKQLWLLRHRTILWGRQHFCYPSRHSCVHISAQYPVLFLGFPQSLKSKYLYRSRFNTFLSLIFFSSRGATAPCGPRPAHYWGLGISNTPHSVGLLWTRDWSVAETSTCQHTTLTRNRQPYPMAGFEPAIPGSDRPQTHDLDSAATGTGCLGPVHK
jgi:hypothetical protein